MLVLQLLLAVAACTAFEQPPMAEMRSAVRWGIAGCGDVTERKSGPGLQRAGQSELRAVMRRDEAKARDFAQRHGVSNSYTSVEGLLQDAEVDAVYVATPPSTHLDIALQVAAAGKPCYMEKPMARNYNESKRMLDAFAQAGLPLFVAYYRRAYPRYQQVQALLTSGELGELSSVQYTLRKKAPQAQPGESCPSQGWRVDVPTSGGGLFVDVGSHLLDLLDFLLGPLREVKGVAARSPEAPATAPEDVVSATFLAGRAIAGSANWNFRAMDNFELLEIVGERGRLSLPEPMNGAVCIVETLETSRRWEVQAPAPAVQEPLIQTVVDAIRAGNPSLCPSTAESALRTAGYLDAVLEGFYGSRADGFWDEPGSWPVNQKPKAA